MPSSAICRDSTSVASRCANVVAGDGSVRSSAGTYTAWNDVIEPFFVDVMRSCSTPISSARSEEHTSELQSRENLVCRLLLEKKKTKRPSPSKDHQS